MTTRIFTAFLQIERQAFGFGEDLLLLAAGIGLIILVFVLRRSGRGKTGVSKNSNKFADLTK